MSVEAVVSVPASCHESALVLPSLRAKGSCSCALCTGRHCCCMQAVLERALHLRRNSIAQHQQEVNTSWAAPAPSRDSAWLAMLMSVKPLPCALVGMPHKAAVPISALA